MIVHSLTYCDILTNTETLDMCITMDYFYQCINMELCSVIPDICVILMILYAYMLFLLKSLQVCIVD